eukprot:scaffold204625_cov50-Cyclotella_meneghiniana.AAC.1
MSPTDGRWTWAGYHRVGYIRGNRFVEFRDQKASGFGAASTMIAADAMVAVFLESPSPPCESEKRLGGISGPEKRALLAVIS